LVPSDEALGCNAQADIPRLFGLVCWLIKVTGDPLTSDEVWFHVLDELPDVVPDIIVGQRGDVGMDVGAQLVVRVDNTAAVTHDGGGLHGGLQNVVDSCQFCSV
jgi:hypothetical protein